MWENLFEPKAYPKKCKICGADFISYSWCGCYCSEKCRKIGKAQYMKNYRREYWKKLRADPGRLEDYQIYHREWAKTKKGRACGRRAMKNYCASENGKKVRKKCKAEWDEKNREYTRVYAREHYYDKCWQQYYEI